MTFSKESVAEILGKKVTDVWYNIVKDTYSVDFTDGTSQSYSGHELNKMLHEKAEQEVN